MKRVEYLQKLNKMNTEELGRELKKDYVIARRMRLEVEAKKNTKHADIRNSRKNIARLLTVMNQK